MSTSSLPALFFIALTAVLFSFGRTPGRRRLLLGAANLVFLSFFVGSWGNAALLAAFILTGYAAARLAEKRGEGAAPLWLLIAGPVALLLYVKRYAFLTLFVPHGLMNHGLEIVGLSYMTFKLIHVLVDARQDALSPLTFSCYANYQLGFFTLLAGPIQRYNDFATYWNADSPLPGTEDALRAWNRILDGMLKSALFGTIALRLYDAATDRLLSHSAGRAGPAAFLLAFYAYPFYIYFNFSGYCDVALGSARLFGLELPENFDRPFTARNMNDFWNRWHMSLTHWIRDYVFMTSYKSVAARWPSFRDQAGYALLFLSLLVAGIWHGSTWNFVLFGLVHGVGVAVSSVYADALKRRLGPAGLKDYLRNEWTRRAAVFATFHYTCFAFLFFPSGLHRTLSLLRAAAGGLRP